MEEAPAAPAPRRPLQPSGMYDCRRGDDGSSQHDDHFGFEVDTTAEKVTSALPVSMMTIAAIRVDTTAEEETPAAPANVTTTAAVGDAQLLRR